MAGLTDKGLDIKRQEDIISSLEENAVSQLGNSVSTGVNSVIGRCLRILSDPMADVYEVMEAVYNQFSPYKASGVNLDNVVAFGHMRRLGASHSTCPLILYGDRDTTIPNGSYTGSTSTAKTWVTTEDVILNTSKVVEFSFTALDATKGSEYRVNFGGYVYSYTARDNDTISNIVNNLYNSLATESSYKVTKEEDDIVRVYLKNFESPRDVTVSQNLTVKKVGKKVSSQSEDLGAIYQPAGTINTITAPISGWDSVTNPVDSTNGRERETDPELIARFAKAKSLNARGTLDAIKSNLISLDNVEFVDVLENDEDITSPYTGLPPKSFSVIVLGGNTDTIAQTIWNTKPVGVMTYGNQTVTVKDSTGRDKSIKFSRPALVPIYIQLEIKPLENELIDSNYRDSITQSLIDHISKLTLGEDVSYSRLFTPINTTTGFEITSLKIGRDPNNLDTKTISINYDEKPTLVGSNLTINKKDI